MSESKLKLNNVRLYYPSIFQKEEYKGQPTPFYGTKVLVDPTLNSIEFRRINAVISNKAKELKLAKLPADKPCWKESENMELKGLWELRAKTKFKPLAITQDKQDIEPESNLIYSGCYANVLVDFWAAPNTPGGKRVGATLLGVQFVKHGAPVGGIGTSKDEFETLEVVTTDEF